MGVTDGLPGVAMAVALDVGIVGTSALVVSVLVWVLALKPGAAQGRAAPE